MFLNFGKLTSKFPYYSDLAAVWLRPTTCGSEVGGELSHV